MRVDQPVHHHLRKHLLRKHALLGHIAIHIAAAAFPTTSGVNELLAPLRPAPVSPAIPIRVGAANALLALVVPAAAISASLVRLACPCSFALLDVLSFRLVCSTPFLCIVSALEATQVLLHGFVPLAENIGTVRGLFTENPAMLDEKGTVELFHWHLLPPIAVEVFVPIYELLILLRLLRLLRLAATPAPPASPTPALQLSKIIIGLKFGLEVSDGAGRLLRHRFEGTECVVDIIRDRHRCQHIKGR